MEGGHDDRGLGGGQYRAEEGPPEGNDAQV